MIVSMNKIRCLNCGTILESKSVHDFQSCGCDNQTFVDGGDEYMRCGGMDMTLIEVFTDSGWKPLYESDNQD